MKNKHVLIIGVVAILIASFFVGRALVEKNKVEQSSFLLSSNAEVFLRDHAYRVGSEKAKVHLVEFMDPECESCRAMHPEVKKLLKEYEGDIQLIIRYAPFHPNSKFIIKILEAARKQNKYDEVLDVLFQYQPAWGDHHNPRPELVWVYLPNIEGLDIDKIRTDMNDPEIDKIINQDIEDSVRLGVKATPTFFVNGRPLPRFGVSYLRDLIKEEHSK